MHHKNIKLIVKKQLKEQYPHWKRLRRKKKKAIAKKVTAEVVKMHDFNKPITDPIEELLGIEEQMPEQGMMNLKEMAKYIDRFNK